MSRTKKVEENVEEAQEVIEETVAQTQEIVTEETQQIKKEEVKEVKQKEAVTYLGPTIKNVVESGTVFAAGRVTTTLEKKMEEITLLKSLLIPTSGLVKAKKELRDKESALSAIYRKAEEAVKNEQ